uniref:Uncharacterized protein n=1 Tax=Zea mays TaxID=4577 RepID=C4J570_MAIZE|nr:unknown [Zea mays]
MAGANGMVDPNAGDIMDGAWSSSRTGGSMTDPMAADASSPPMIHLRKVWSGASPGGAAASAASHPSPAPRPMSSGVSCHSSLPPATASSAPPPPGHAAAATGGGETFLALAPARAATPAVAAPRGDDSVGTEVGGLGLGLCRRSSTEVGSQRSPAPETLPAASPCRWCCSCSCSSVPACPSRALPAKSIPLI